MSSSITNFPSVREAYQEYTTETYKNRDNLFQCPICLEDNTRRYMDCCENFICSSCWYGWFGPQKNLNCPHPYCKEKLFSVPLKETGGYQNNSLKNIKCPCCDQTSHSNIITTVQEPDGSYFGMIGNPPPNFPMEDIKSKIKEIKDLIQSRIRDDLSNQIIGDEIREKLENMFSS